MFLIAAPTQHLGFSIEHNNLEAYINPGAFTVLGMVPYDRIAHRVLRLREVSGELLWEGGAAAAREARALRAPAATGLARCSGIRTRTARGPFQGLPFRDPSYPRRPEYPRP